MSEALKVVPNLDDEALDALLASPHLDTALRLRTLAQAAKRESTPEQLDGARSALNLYMARHGITNHLDALVPLLKAATDGPTARELCYAVWVEAGDNLPDAVAGINGTADPAEREEHPLVARVREALDRAESIREELEPTSAQARKEVAGLLGKTWAYVPGAILADIAACDVGAMVDKLVVECSEIDVDEHHAPLVDIVWRVKAASSGGMTILGTCKPVGKRERQTWRGDGPAPFWRLTLALDLWVLLTEQERWRLVHHELMHATYKGTGTAAPSGRAHDIEEFAATVARYGLGHQAQATFVGQAIAREGDDLAERWGVDPVSGQGLLFGTDLKPVGW